jgi:predicted DCC family thiol-disulfide oxidoreductase YuxK
MVQFEAQPPYASGGTHVVVYDGVCALCSRLVQFLLRHDRHRVFSFASLQSAVGKSLVERSGGNPCELTSFYVVANYQTADSRALTRSDAALFVADALGWPWRAAQKPFIDRQDGEP